MNHFPLSRALSFLSAMTCSLAAGALHAQHRMDTMDSLTAARSAAYNRVKEGYFTSALTSGETALKITENRFGKNHPSVAQALNDLATIHRYLGRYSEAESALKWGLAIREKNLKAGDPLIADSMGRLAGLYDDWGRWEAAEQAGKSSLSLLETSPDTRSLIRSLNVLGGIKLHLQKHQEASALLKRSLSLQEKSPDGGTTLHIDTLNTLAKADGSGKRFAEAEAGLQKALKAAQRTFPAESVEMADAMENLADFYQSRDQKEKAQPLFESAFKIYRNYVGVDYSYPVLSNMKRLAKAYRSLGNNKEAKDLLEKSLKTIGETFGPSHPEAALCLLELARVEESLGEKKKAAQRLKASLAISGALFPKTHPLVTEAETLLVK